MRSGNSGSLSSLSCCSSSSPCGSIVSKPVPFYSKNIQRGGFFGPSHRIGAGIGASVGASVGAGDGVGDGAGDGVGDGASDGVGDELVLTTVVRVDKEFPSFGEGLLTGWNDAVVEEELEVLLKRLVVGLLRLLLLHV